MEKDRAQELSRCSSFAIRKGRRVDLRRQTVEAARAWWLSATTDARNGKTPVAAVVNEQGGMRRISRRLLGFEHQLLRMSVEDEGKEATPEPVSRSSCQLSAYTPFSP